MTTSTIELLSTDELIAAVADLNIEQADTREGRIEASRAYWAAVSNLEVQWQEWLRTQYLPQAPQAVHTKVFNLAWSENHGDGWSSVESLYIDLADLVNEAHANW